VAHPLPAGARANGGAHADSAMRCAKPKVRRPTSASWSPSIYHWPSWTDASTTSCVRESAGMEVIPRRLIEVFASGQEFDEHDDIFQALCRTLDASGAPQGHRRGRETS